MSFRDVVELAVEFVMEGLLIYVAYLFWLGYRRTRDRGLLFLNLGFVALAVLHAIFPLYLEDIAGVKLAGILEPHVWLFLILLGALVFVLGQTSWRAPLRRDVELEIGGERRPAA